MPYKIVDELKIVNLFASEWIVLNLIFLLAILFSKLSKEHEWADNIFLNLSVACICTIRFD